MLFGLLVAVLCGTALARPEPHHGHEMRENPFGGSSLTEVAVCDYCNQTISWLQREIGTDKEQIIGYIELIGEQVCAYLPEAYQPNCIKFVTKEIPTAIDEFLELDPFDLCADIGLCPANGPFPRRNEHAVRDRVVKQMLKRTRDMQQDMFLMTMRQDTHFLCDKCLDFLESARDVLLDNNTQAGVTRVVYEICDYMPLDYLYSNCTDFADSIPLIMEQIANDLFADSTCYQIGLCNDTISAPVDPVDTIKDILNRFGQSPFIPSIDIPVNPGHQRPEPARHPYGPAYGVPQRPIFGPQDDTVGKNQGGHMPEIPDIFVPGLGRIDFGNNQRRRQRNADKMLGFDFDKIMPGNDGIVDKVIEYLPEPFPSAGITVKTEKKHPVPGKEDCKMCKAAVFAIKSWLKENSGEIKRMVLQVAEPVCAVLPGFIRDDCVTDVTEFMESFLHEAIHSLDEDRICKWIGSCVKDKHLPPKEPALPTENAAPEVPTTRLIFP